MVKTVRIADEGVRDTTSVELEIVGIDSNGERTNVIEGNTHSVFSVSNSLTLFNINKGSNTNNTEGLVVFARTINSSVGIS